MSDKKQLEKIRGMSPEEQEQVIHKIEQSAYEYEWLYGGCGRSTLRALQEGLGIDDGETFRAATPFSGGAHNNELCGALAGGIMAIGLVYASGEFEQGKVEDRPLSVKSPVYERAGERANKLCDRFREEFGGLRCRDVMQKLHGKVWNLQNPEERAEYVQPRLHDKCGEVAQKTARFAAEVILEKSPGDSDWVLSR